MYSHRNGVYSFVQNVTYTLKVSPSPLQCQSLSTSTNADGQRDAASRKIDHIALHNDFKNSFTSRFLKK